MPFELLKRLSCEKLPVNVEAQEDIDKLLILHAAGLIEADIPESKEQRGYHTYAGQTIVMKVTQRGQAALQSGIVDLHGFPAPAS